MSKYCKAYALYVTYLDCIECEDKTCRKQRNINDIQKVEEEGMAITKCYLNIEPEQTVFVVFASKREGYKENVVIRCKVKECIVRSNTTLYCLRKEKIVTGQKNIDAFIDNFMCENANIDTGYRGLQTDKYPVFTTKNRCIKWLKG